MAYATLDGYIVRKTTDAAIGITKATGLLDPLIWLPKAACMDGDDLGVGDTDIVCRESMADNKGLDYK